MKNINLSYAFFFLLLTLTTQAFAMYGFVEKTVPESTCQLVTLNPDLSPRSICTGVLISPTQVATAAHCLKHLVKAPERSLSVKCGYQGIAQQDLKLEKTLKGTSFYSSGVLFAENLEVNEVFIHPQYWTDKQQYDVGLITLKSPSKITPVPLEDTKKLTDITTQAFNNKTIAFNSCKVSGFGIDENDVAGLPGSAMYNSSIYFKDDVYVLFGYVEKIENKKEQNSFAKAIESPNPLRSYFHFLTNYLYIAAILDSGDSGGPLTCLVDNNWRMVGVGMGYDLQVKITVPYSITYQQFWAPYFLSEITEKIH